MSHQPVPDEEDNQRADRCADQTCALVELIPTDGLADKGRNERAGDSQRGSQNETAWIVWTRGQDARNDACDQADDDEPKGVRHARSPSSL